MTCLVILFWTHVCNITVFIAICGHLTRGLKNLSQYVGLWKGVWKNYRNMSAPEYTHHCSCILFIAAKKFTHLFRAKCFLFQFHRGKTTTNRWKIILPTLSYLDLRIPKALFRSFYKICWILTKLKVKSISVKGELNILWCLWW